jgi:hypothetical protein
MIDRRLKSVKALEGRVKILSKSEAISGMDILLKLFSLDSNSLHKTLEMDFSSSVPKDISDWLSKLEISEQEILVYWLSSKEGLQISCQDFLMNYDELWYPGADDVLVTNQQKAWILKLHHEEIFSFYVL